MTQQVIENQAERLAKAPKALSFWQDVDTLLPIHFVSGLPRSGSTLLINLLAQNRIFHATPTSGVVDLLATIRTHWQDNISFRSQGLAVIRPRIRKLMAGALFGFFAKEFTNGEQVLDKSRGWLAYIEMMEEVLERPVVVIATVRDVKAIVASFERLRKENPLTRHPEAGDAFYDCQTMMGRTLQLLSKSAVLGLSINRLRDALERGLGSRLFIVPFQQLVHTPLEVISQLYSRLGLPVFSHDPNNVVQVTKEDDTVHGYPLHIIRPKIEPPPITWPTVLNAEVATYIDRHYADINKLAAS